MLVGAGIAVGTAMVATAMVATAMAGTAMVARPSTSAWGSHSSMAATMEPHIPTMATTMVIRDPIAATTDIRDTTGAIMVGPRSGMVEKETETRPHCPAVVVDCGF